MTAPTSAQEAARNRTPDSNATSSTKKDGDAPTARTESLVTQMNPKRAVVLRSGGLDSATLLALARSEGYIPYAMSFLYGQRHAIEVKAARTLVERAEVLVAVPVSAGGVVDLAGGDAVAEAGHVDVRRDVEEAPAGGTLADHGAAPRRRYRVPAADIAALADDLGQRAPAGAHPRHGPDKGPRKSPCAAQAGRPGKVRRPLPE